ncbi:MAG TPA: Gfo/Idh/MocA family oxidoreductase [Phycisphaerae bacterium]|nr:Gfo/Idh/MocA family oxidoreductase [Phycisphaerae bacterium]
MFRSRNSAGSVRYAVVGLGHIAQVAVLPAFARARESSELTALVSGDPVKLKKLGKDYKIDRLYSYDQYEDCLNSGEVDAVYIALPNSMHCEFAIRAAEAGVHVLCEKPMAVTMEECEDMIVAADRCGVAMMIAYRLHFEAADLKAQEIADSGKLGDLRIFNSVFTMTVRRNNIRVERELGGGPLYDIGIYCINAARSLFRSEPYEVLGEAACRDDERFIEVPEMVSAVMRFPGERLANFTCSFGAADVSSYELVGTRGHLRVNPAYEYAEALQHELVIGKKRSSQKFGKRDQFGPELVYFSNCVLNRTRPEPSGIEGLADVRVIQAIMESCRRNAPVGLAPFEGPRHPSPQQEIKRRKIRKPQPVHAASASVESE